jgi:hypothetical protein
MAIDHESDDLTPPTGATRIAFKLRLKPEDHAFLAAGPKSMALP